MDEHRTEMHIDDHRTRTNRRRRRAIGPAVMALALLTANCSSDSESKSSEPAASTSASPATTVANSEAATVPDNVETTVAADDEETTTVPDDSVAATVPDDTEATTPPTDSVVDPVIGGEITIGEFSPPRGFDPIAGGASNGSVGGMELMALYDTVVSWNPETAEYEPRTAESLEPNDDYTEWTLVLKDGITFTDGTAYDAEAVKFNIERALLPNSRSQAKVVLQSLLDTMTVVDPTTLVFTLSRPWTGFPYVLSIDAGMIASPTAVQAAGDGFASNPGDAGAGPFKLVEYRPGESIVFERNENYYGGEVPLDKVTFVPTPGGQEAAYAALEAGELDAAYFRSPVAIADATDDGLTIHRAKVAAGNVMDINAGVFVTCQGGLPEGCEGVADGEGIKTSPPGADLRIRQAVAAAIDPDQVNERAYQGLAVAGTALFSDDFPNSPSVAGPAYDPELAARLVAEAKADGWDGSIRLYSVTDEVGQALGLTVSAMLSAVGIDVQLDSSFEPLPLTLEVIINHNFDLVIWGSGLTENPDGNYATVLGGYGSAAESTGYHGYSSAEMDAAIAAMEVADSEAAIQDAYAMLAEVWTADVPAVALNELENALITRPDLEGVSGTSNTSFLFSGAWLAS